MFWDEKFYELYRRYHIESFKRGMVILLVLVFIFGIPLGVSYLYCEQLTGRYAGEMLADLRSEIVEKGEMLVQFKVLRYKGGILPEASVYTVTENRKSKVQHEMVYRISYRYGQWNIEDTGSWFAWPYSLIPDFDFSVSIGP